MRKTLTYVFLIIIFALDSLGEPQSSIRDLRPLTSEIETIKNDLSLILTQAKLNDFIDFQWIQGSENTTTVSCSKNRIAMTVRAQNNWAQVFYYGLQRMGFLFPHPRMQISPTANDLKKKCGQTYHFRPALKYYGFHFHTLHPSEWVHGFLTGQTEIAIDTVRWLARNQQNIFDIYMLDMDEETMFKSLSEPFSLAKKMGLHAGVTVGMVFHQQNAYKLIPLWASPFAKLSLKHLKKNLTCLLDNVDVSFINLEAGTSEFTPTRYELSTEWMNTVASLSRERDVAVVVKIHNSSNQVSKKYGNFNFLPQHADSDVGILPHTVFLYSLEAESAPMYGNKNFHDMRDFMLQEKDKRRTWFYPETSYFCALDIDVPLFLTNYLLTRSEDLKFLYANQIEGQLNFSTGHELGYWLFDWTTTLLNNLDYKFDPSIGLKLLGEHEPSWKKIIDFQDRFFVKNGLISIITFSTLGDELLPGFHQTLKRNLPRDLKNDPEKLEQEILLLNLSLENVPNENEIKIKSEEFQILWQVTLIRIEHALNVRLALKHSDKKDFYLNKAVSLRFQAQEKLERLIKNHSRYPEASIFQRHDNPTAYKFGYGYTAANLFYRHREEEIIRQNNYRFYFMPLYSLKDVLTGWVM